jgi:hypothetical protein
VRYSPAISELSGSVRKPRADAILVEGLERKTATPVRALCFGGRDDYAFLFGRIFSEFRELEERPNIQVARARSCVARYSGAVDPVCVDVELLCCRLFDWPGFLAIPQWICQKYAVPELWSGVVASFRRNTRKTDLRRIRQHRLQYRITRSNEDFRQFYHDMYAPYLRHRFGDEVIVEPEWKVLRQCRKGELMHIVRDSQVVAAVLLHLQGDRLAYVWVGVLEGLEEDLFQGAFSAMYYYTILYGYEQGCKEVDFLGSRPLLNDGLFQYKRKWGTYVEDSPVPRGDILLKPTRFTESVASVVAETPFIVRDGADLVGKVLVPGGALSYERVRDIHSRLFAPGLRALEVHALGGFDEDVRMLATELGDAIRLVDLKGHSDPAAQFCSRRNRKEPARLIGMEELVEY